MKQDSVLVKIVPDVRRKKGDTNFPLKIRVTYKGDRKYFGTGFDCSLDEWELVNSDKAKGKLRVIKNEVAAIEKKAQECCDGIVPFSFVKFEDAFFEKPLKYENLKAAFETYIKQLLKNGQIGTATSYQTAINSLLAYKKNASFEIITPSFLRDYEFSMVEKGKSLTTVGIYLRPLRAIFNQAMEDGIIDAKSYPFGLRKYVIPTGKGSKRALNIDDIGKIFNYNCEPHSTMDKAKDFWIFSYLCNGINMMDICKLKWANLEKDQIIFERQKTIRTRKGDPLKIAASRNNYINAIIEKWGITDRSPDNNVFGIIDQNDNLVTARNKIQQFTKTTNKWMKRLGAELGIDLKLTSYVARHSFATILIRNGAPMEFASQSLGHSSLLTTQKYFSGFDLSAHKKFTSALTNFELRQEAVH